MPPRFRIAIIPAKYAPGLQYQENVYAAALHAEGHDVSVFAVSGDEDRDDAKLPFPVVRTSSYVRLRTTVLLYGREIGRKLRDFDPDIAFVVAPNHGPGIALLGRLPARCRVISSFSDLPWHRGAILSWIKGWLARKAVKRSKLVLTATEESRALVCSWAGPELAGRVRLFGLPFSRECLVDGALHPLADDIVKKCSPVVALVTTIRPSKRLDILFGAVERFLRSNPAAGFVVAGFDGSAASMELRDLILRSPCADRCAMLPFLNSAEVGALFRVADCSLWSLVSIGIYHSLHCGCPVLVQEGQDARHLLADRSAGRFYSDLDSLDSAIGQLLSAASDRERVSRTVDRYEAVNAVRELVRAVMEGSPSS